MGVVKYIVSLIIPSTGDPEIIDPLFKSIIQNTVGEYTVTVMKQEIAHPKADETYAKWKRKRPDWKFLSGTEGLLYSARNMGFIESYVDKQTEGVEQWFAEMDDDVILPPRWDEDMINAAEKIGEGEIFVPLLTFRAPIYYQDQVAILSLELWKALMEGDIDRLNQFYLEEFKVEDPIFKRCLGPEVCFIMRRNRSLIPLLWDTAFDIQRRASYGNFDLMLKLKKYGWSAWVVRSVLIFHRGFSRIQDKPKFGYAKGTLKRYLSQKWPQDNPGELPGVLLGGGPEKEKFAGKNMPRGLPKGAAHCFSDKMLRAQVAFEKDRREKALDRDLTIEELFAFYMRHYEWVKGLCDSKDAVVREAGRRIIKEVKAETVHWKELEDLDLSKERSQPELEELIVKVTTDLGKSKRKL